ncbi:lipid phosphate phosphatase epsilon 2, chloroplastic-like protein [Cinnamomum micranthum f. kanehirae]|uniref:Lipid phosphate phosphatase epsilon 2, chloroplastic-like protein n=1 Tax=Cinnamomum micranthum f. kanehirae TaxID=337451 RepID=A0A443PTK8_9MAGN|nr:lipid phosphate phosphatase epsilon 2, chloroplastic-like protein [Cinnamomum micranthum f. kanehirae]
MSVVAAAAAVSYIPTFRSSSRLTCRLKSPKPISFHKFPTTKSVVKGVFLSRMSGFKNTMTEMSTAAAFRSSDGDEDAGYLETQTILRSRSSEIGRELELGGLQSAMNQSSKWLVSALFGAIIIWKHDAEVMWAAMGAVTNSYLSITLKRILNQQRPVPTLRSDPGMPSSHAQSIFYAVVFAIVSLVEWLGINAFTLTAGACLFICGSYFSWLRVSQQLHTINQVVVGAILGSIFSIAWFWSWDAFVSAAFTYYLWVRIVVILCSICFCLAFLVYVIKNWLVEDD